MSESERDSGSALPRPPAAGARAAAGRLRDAVDQPPRYGWPPPPAGPDPARPGSAGDQPGRIQPAQHQPPQAQSSELGQPGAAAQPADLLPSVTLPKGGGAIRSLDEKFAVTAATGAAGLSVPLPFSPGRSGFTPQLVLGYESAGGNGPFGLGWSAGLTSITRKTSKGLPRYRDGDESDVFMLTGQDDLVRVLDTTGNRVTTTRVVYGTRYLIEYYRPRVEGLFSRIERWTDPATATSTSTGISHWRTISRDNVTTLYGEDPGSRIADPADPARIFSWLISRSFDDKGNACAYGYLPEDSTGISQGAAHEANRTPASRSAQVYLKRIRYGNTLPYLPDWSAPAPAPMPADWLFQVVLDYGDHGSLPPSSQPDQPWPVRPDPFSSYRAGFELRTYRRVQRILFFHNFPAEPTAGPDCLVRSLDLTYSDQVAPPDPASPRYTLLTAVSRTGYRHDASAGLVTRGLPPLELSYSQPTFAPDVLTLDPGSGDNLPQGLDGTRYRWADLDGEGLAGILTDDPGGAWYYKRNLSAANLMPQPDGSLAARASFGPLETVAALPSQFGLASVRLLDLGGRGQLDVVSLAGPDRGYFARTADRDFDPLRRFAALPALDWSDPNLAFIDVTGDGLADILVTEEGLFTLHASLGEAGFGPARLTRTGWDEERGPAIVLADGTQTIFTADMTGDGLTDLVRVRNGEACYWPSTGYGGFGAKVTMDGAPRFDSEDRFDPRRVLLADIDGTGTADLLYAAQDGVSAWFNQSGNSWSAVTRLAVFPAADSLAAVRVLDLLGTGTACLTWSSPLPSASPAPLRYVDLMGGVKPHLLTGIRNNLGAETRVSYAPSTRFYLADELAGTPWITRLPFPVQVVERTETIDWIGRSRQVCRYSYHHGYYDGFEREFRGFGRVDQTDTEEFRADTGFDDGDVISWDQQSWSPPVLTRTWLHTGAFTAGPAISAQYRGEYWTEPGADAAAMLLPDGALPAGLAADETREACRALKGRELRTETYAQDGTPQAVNPYAVAEYNYAVTCLQPMGQQRHAVCWTVARESVSFLYERGTGDPRASHELVLDCDQYGNVLSQMSVGYPRRGGYPPPEPALPAAMQQALAYDQGRLRVTGTQHSYTNAIDDLAGSPDAYRTPRPAGTDTGEITGVAPTVKGSGITSLFAFDEAAQLWATAWTAAADVPYEQLPAADVDGAGSPAAGPARRLLARLRTVYRSDDMTALLPSGQLESLALPGQTYRAALTPGLAAAVYGTVLPGASLTAALAEGGYLQLGGDPDWWQPSARVYFSAGDADTPAQELAAARAAFFLPRRTVDPFGGIARAGYDGYALLAASATDPVGNQTTAVSDYRVLRPAALTDPNGNIASVAFDALGMVTATASGGKATESAGDELTGFAIDLDDATLAAQLADPLAAPAALLGQATTRLVYDLHAYQRTAASTQPSPPATYTLARRIRVSDLAVAPYPGAPTVTGYQYGLSYSDGYGRVIQAKALVAPGPVTAGGPVMSPRWAGTGWTIYDNKGRPVRTYEPFFSVTAGFEFAAVTGVATATMYDPPGRVVARLYPDDSWAKTAVSPWLEQSWDRDDTALIADPRADADVGPYFARLLPAGPFTTWYQARASGTFGQSAADRAAWQAAAQQAAAVAGTPDAVHRDTAGRACLTVADNGTAGRYASRTATDTAGTPLAIIDPLGRRAAEFCLRQAGGGISYLAGTDMAGQALYHSTCDGGARRSMSDVTGAMIRSFDARGHAFRLTFDAARRPLRRYLATGGAPEVLIEMSVYGEGQAAANLCGREFRHYDQAGYLENTSYDYAGNRTATLRQLASGYQQAVDWTLLAGLSGAAALDSAAAAAGLIPSGDGGRDAFAAATRYDALNRPVQLVMEHNAAMAPDVLQPGYDEGSQLAVVDAWLQQPSAPAALLAPATATLHAVTGIGYNARGQRVSISYGNGVSTAYSYDQQTFRLSSLTTSRPGGGQTVQDLAYYYDPAGNITRIADSADTQNVIFFRNQRVDPSSDYRYDAVYRLISAAGREHLGQAGTALAVPQQITSSDAIRTGLPQPGDGNAMGRYTETYGYDAASSLLAMTHQTASGSWARQYSYTQPSQIDAAQTSNRPAATSLPGDPAGGPYSARYQCDAHGNLTAMPQLPVMTWDADDRLRSTARQQPVTGSPQQAWYAYASSDQRVRKVITAPATAPNAPVRKAERIYLGGIEVYREFAADGTTVTLERQTLRIADGARPVTLVETRVTGHDPGPAQQVRYQHGNQLDSAVLELSDTAGIISYEEYFPFGATAYQAVAAQTDVPKRYRFTGKERDTENDLYYHGARYYAPWLGLWIGCDPVGSAAGQTPYGYAAQDPVRYTDPTGRDPVPDPHSRQSDPLPGDSAVPGTSYLPPLTPRPAINAMNSYFATMSQGSGVMTEDSIDVESGALVITSRTTGLTLRLPVWSGGLASGVLAIRKQIPSLPGFDAGVAATGSYTGQGSTSVTTAAGTPGTDPAQTQGSGTALITAHYGRQNLWGTALSGALYLSGGYQHLGQTGMPDVDAGVFQIMPAFGFEWDPPSRDSFRLSDPPVNPYEFYLASIMLNPVFNYASRGQLSQGPQMNDVMSLGGIASVGVGWGKYYGLVGEVSVTGNWGSPLAGSDQSASSLAERVGLIFTTNYYDHTTSGPQTSSIAFGLWYAHESGSTSGVTGSSGWNADSVIGGLIFGYRRAPQR